MIPRPNRTIVAAATLFLVSSAAVDVTVAGIYARGIERFRASPIIGERDVRLLARPIRLHPGDRISNAALLDHLRRIGYYAGCADRGCFTADDRSVTVRSRFAEIPDAMIGWYDGAISWVASAGGDAIGEAVIEPETLLTLTNDPGGSISRARHEPIPYAALADTPLLDAIVASEDRWFPSHHGVDFGRLSLVPFVGGGASTVTMQVARLSVLQDRSRTLPRKLNEIGAAMVLERVYPKDAIMAAYVNTVDLGARRGRPLHGFGAAADEFFGVTDVRTLTTLQAATLVALLNQPSRYLDDLEHGDDTRLRGQRNRVLRLMGKNFPSRYASPALAQLENQPVTFPPKGRGAEDLARLSGHFIDYASGSAPRLPRGRIYLTLDANLQRLAVDTTTEGLLALQQQRPAAAGVQLQAALIALDPRSGDVLAMVGARSYDGSQFNRAVRAARQVGSIMKPFDYLAALEYARDAGRSDLSPDTLVLDAPAIFTFAGRRPWKPSNYEQHYAGLVTWRRALAESRNVAAVKVASIAGVDRVARLWEAASGQELRDRAPAITLGALDAPPAAVARAYAMLANDGVSVPLRTVRTVVSDGKVTRADTAVGRRVARRETVAEVVDMLRSVLNDGTGRGARAAGLTIDAAGKTGTTNDLRDAWFAGFTHDLLAVVWVGRDDNQPLGLTGAQAALPIWTEFMKRAAQADTTAAPSVRSQAMR